MKGVFFGILISIFAWHTTFAQVELPFTLVEQQEYFINQKKVAGAGYKGCFIYNYVTVNGNLTSGNYKSEEIKFDVHGKVNEIIHYTPQGAVTSIDIYNYTHRSTPKSITSFSPNGQQIGKKLYDYYPLGHLKYITEYDAYGYILKKTEVMLSDSTNKACVYVYTSPDRYITKKCFVYSGLKIGKLLEINEYNANNQLSSHTLNIYNKKLEKAEITEHSNRFVLLYTYSPQGNLELVQYMGQNKQKVEITRYNYNDIQLQIGIFERATNGKIKRMVKIKYF